MKMTARLFVCLSVWLLLRVCTHQDHQRSRSGFRRVSEWSGLFCSLHRRGRGSAIKTKKCSFASLRTAIIARGCFFPILFVPRCHQSVCCSLCSAKPTYLAVARHVDTELREREPPEGRPSSRRNRRKDVAHWRRRREERSRAEAFQSLFCSVSSF